MTLTDKDKSALHALLGSTDGTRRVSTSQVYPGRAVQPATARRLVLAGLATIDDRYAAEGRPSRRYRFIHLTEAGRTALDAIPRLRAFGAEYQRRARGDSPCAQCGRTVKAPVRWMVECVQGGGNYVRHTDDAAEVDRLRADRASYMGFWPVGPECRKTLMADGVIVTNMLVLNPGRHAKSNQS